MENFEESKKITILALHLSSGGTERTISNLSNMLAKKYDVEIISNYKIDEEPTFKIDDKVKIKYLMPDLKPNGKKFKLALKKLNVGRIFKEGFKAIKILYLRRKLMIEEIKQLSCNIAISTRYLYNGMLGKYGNKDIIKIAQEHNNNGNEKYVKKVIKSLKNIDYFMPVSNSLTEMYKKKLVNTKTKCVYIPHCISNYPEQVSNLEDNNILSVSRLSKEKGFLDLIDVFEIVNKSYPNWHLNIVGEGDMRNEITRRIQEKGLNENVSLTGFKKQEELNSIFLKSSIYVMTSFYESFGLALIEAESYGIPILAFDSAEGPKEIIKNENNGYLIANRNKQDMADKIMKLINNLELRQKMGQNARKNSEGYKMENIEKIWYKFIDDISIKSFI